MLQRNVVSFRAVHVCFDGGSMYRREHHTAFSKVPIAALTYIGRELASDFERDSQA